MSSIERVRECIDSNNLERNDVENWIIFISICDRALECLDDRVSDAANVKRT